MHEFSETLAHGNSKNKIRQRNRGSRYDEKSEYGKKNSGYKKISPNFLTEALVLGKIIASANRTSAESAG